MPVTQVLSASIQIWCESCSDSIVIKLTQPCDSDEVDRDALALAEDAHGWIDCHCQKCLRESRDYDDGDYDPYEL